MWCYNTLTRNDGVSHLPTDTFFIEENIAEKKKPRPLTGNVSSEGKLSFLFTMRGGWNRNRRIYLSRLHTKKCTFCCTPTGAWKRGGQKLCSCSDPQGHSCCLGGEREANGSLTDPSRGVFRPDILEWALFFDSPVNSSVWGFFWLPRQQKNVDEIALTNFTHPFIHPPANRSLQTHNS